MAQEEAQEEGESIFASVTDLMVGFLFIFLLLLVYFAIQYKRTTEELVDAETQRSTILEQLQTQMNQQNVAAKAEPELGVLRLPEEVLFPKGSATLTPAGEEAIAVLARSIRVVLRCQLGETEGCDPASDKVETVLIEGHTDADPLGAGNRYRDNWELSSARALATYQALMAAVPELAQAQSPDAESTSKSLFGVSGYGPDRPVAPGSTEAEKRLNRRIDVRLLMQQPDAQ